MEGVSYRGRVLVEVGVSDNSIIREERKQIVQTTDIDRADVREEDSFGVFNYTLL